jgi:hypothetical protein
MGAQEAAKPAPVAGDAAEADPDGYVRFVKPEDAPKAEIVGVSCESRLRSQRSQLR